MKRIGILVLVALSLAPLPVAPAAAAEESRAVAPFGENVKLMLDASVGRAVTLQLTSGQEIGGTVTRVGDHAVQLSRVSGRDFYDAVVLLDRVSVVLFKVVGR